MLTRTKTVLGLSLAAVAAGGLLREAAIGRDWRAFQEVLERRVREVEARACERPALCGEPLAGDSAWEHYERALRAAEAAPVEDQDLLRFLERRAGCPSHAELAAALDGSQAWLQPLRLGARSLRAARPHEWRRGASAPLPRLLTSRRLANLAAAEAELLRAAGRAPEAAELLLDVLQLGRDHARNAVLVGEMIGVALEAIALERLAGLLEADALDPAHSGRLADALALLDEGPTHRHGIRNDALAVAVTFTAEEVQLGALSGNPAWSARLAAWRSGFSFRRLMLEHHERAEEFAALMERACELPWDEARPAIEAFQRRVEHDPNLITRITLPTLTSVEQAWRRAEAQLRLARAGAELRAGRPARAWPDPFGDVLRLERRGDDRVLWSRGQDGVDDGGAGGFAQGADLVLRLASGPAPR